MLGLDAEARLIPPIVDGASARRAALSERRRLTTSALRFWHCPSSSAMSMWSTTALGAGLLRPRDRCRAARSSAPPVCTCVYARSVDTRDIVGNDDCTGYTMAFPDRGGLTRSCNPTWRRRSTSIGCSISRAWRAQRFQSVAISRKDLLAGVDTRVLSAEPAKPAVPPLYFGGRRTRTVRRHHRRGRRCSDSSTRHGYSDMMRAVFEGLAFAARDCYEAMGPTFRGRSG